MSFVTGWDHFDFQPLGDGRVRIQVEVAFLDAVHGLIVVPAGFVCDLASYPRLARPFFDRLGRSMRSAVIHDWLYEHQPLSKRQADRIFREALRDDGNGWLARWLSWAGVAVGGWWAWWW